MVDHLSLVHSVGAGSECNLKISKVGNGLVSRNEVNNTTIV